MIAVFVIAALCIGADRLTKYLAVSALYPDGSVDVIEGVLRFTYVENRGAAFGSFSDSRWVFLVFSAVLIAAIGVYAVKHRPKEPLLSVSLGLLLGGGIGNMIDRIALGYVVDFIDFCAFPSLWKWVFNAADAFVCIGTALLMIYVLMLDDGKKKLAEDKPEKSEETEEFTKGGTEDE